TRRAFPERLPRANRIRQRRRRLWVSRRRVGACLMRTYLNPHMLVRLRVHDTSYHYGWHGRRFDSNGDLRYQVIGSLADGSAENFGCYAVEAEADARAEY